MKFLLLSILLSSAAWAQNGADILLQTTGTADATDIAAAPEAGELKLTDAYLQTLFMEWRQAKVQNIETNRWFNLVLSGKYASAAHQWSALQNNLPSELLPVARETWVYLTWKMNLPQTFVDAYLDSRMNPQAPERLRLALDQVLNAEVKANWVAEHRPDFNDVQSNYLLSLTAPVGVDLELAAFAARYRADHANRVISLLPMGHPQSFVLAQTAVLDWTRKKEIGEAGKLLKRRIEPEMNKTKAAKELARHYLTLGRLLYQAGAFEASEAFYAKVPRGMPEYLPARTERTWALLRLGRVSELRGELASLSHKVFADRFMPEVGLVRSISNLKLCRYDDVAKDFAAFIENNKKWATKIQTALNDPANAKIDMADDRIQEITLALADRQSESDRLEKLAQESIRAALPAVGIQAHWVNAKSSLALHTQAEQSALVAQKTRFWKNREVVLTEAIRKMKFVRIEAMGQVRMAQTDTKEIEVTDITKKIDSSREHGAQIYPFDGVYWPDELFKLHAAATTRCGGKSL